MPAYGSEVPLKRMIKGQSSCQTRLCDNGSTLSQYIVLAIKSNCDFEVWLSQLTKMYFNTLLSHKYTKPDGAVCSIFSNVRKVLTPYTMGYNDNVIILNVTYLPASAMWPWCISPLFSRYPYKVHGIMIRSVKTRKIAAASQIYWG